MSKFITFEGGEGSGKTTQSKLLFEYLKSQNIKCIWTREIGGTEIAEKIRDIILHNEIHIMTELLLVMAARKEHIENVILPALLGGVTVVCDRFIDSTLCYQGQSLGIAKVLGLHKEVFGDFFPDLTFFIDVPVEEGLRRWK
jgi:dTMP kinase